MKLKDLKVGTQLRLGMGAILVLVAGLTGLAWVQTDLLWQQMVGLYNHPLTVRRALGDIRAQILTMHRDQRDLCLAASDDERQHLLQSIAACEADVQRQIGVLYDRYLGPRGDVEAVEQACAKWKPIRDETLRALRDGKTTEALNLTQPRGSNGHQVDTILGAIARMSDFAWSRADQFYREAGELNRSLKRQLGVIVAGIFTLALVIFWRILKWIMSPLHGLTVATELFRQGTMDARCGYVSGNEIGVLGASFNAMAEVIQTETRVSKHAAQLASVMLREDEVHAFCRELLKALLPHTGSQVGAVYLLNDARTAFEHVESIGLGPGGRATFAAAELEGELGVAVATREIQHITEIPADTRFGFAAVSGEFMPRAILTIPVLADHTVTAVISLASIRAYEPSSIRLVREIWSVLTARVNGVLTFRRVQELAARLEHQNGELDAQKRELAAQTAELTVQNVELEAQKRQVDEANRLKSAFLSNMSHELRTPLNSVIALAGVLGRRLRGAIAEEEYSYLEVIERNGRNLLALLNDILDLSRVEAGREEIRVGHFAVRDLAAEVVSMLDPQASEKGLALRNQVPGDLPPVASDWVKCRHILQNLLGNAVKFTEGGSVEVSARQVGEEIRVAVTDTGIGIAADQLPYIFDEFRQADDSTSRKYGGTGLGLAIARKYARLLGGDIEVSSAPGRGSTFTLTLPLAVELPGVAKALDISGHFGGDATGPTPAPGDRGQSILLVEDNEPAIIQVTDILLADGYRVQVARNGREALEQIGQKLPDAMILDLMMPEVDGFGVLKVIRGMERTAHLPVLILTAKHVTPEELSFLRGNHIHQLIQKGDIDRAGLLAAVAAMVAPPQGEPAPPPRHRPARPGKPVVLVVEDNPDNLRTARALLAESYLVVEAEDGRAGVEQARRHVPDVILMDLSLPVMDGFAALEAIRREETLKHIPVIAVTASAMKGNREDILARGFDDYISKPIDHELLWLALRKVLGETSGVSSQEPGEPHDRE